MLKLINALRKGLKLIIGDYLPAKAELLMWNTTFVKCKYFTEINGFNQNIRPHLNVLSVPNQFLERNAMNVLGFFSFKSPIVKLAWITLVLVLRDPMPEKLEISIALRYSKPRWFQKISPI